MKKDLLLNVATAYTQAGLSVLPTGNDKIPRVKFWKSRTIQKPSLQTIHNDFSGNSCSVAIICGRISGHVENLDFDIFAEWFSDWRKLVDKDAPGLVDKLVIQQTQNGGCHATYTCSGGVIPGSQKLASDFIEVSGSGQHTFEGKTYQAVKRNKKYYIQPCYIETRGEGSYFLAAPSKGYTLVNGRFTELPDITPQEREILISAAKALNRAIPEAVTGHQITTSNDQAPGNDFNRRGDVATLLSKHGWVNTQRKSQDGEHWRRPGKDKGQSATLFSDGVFYNFSSNAAPFEADKSYSPFAVYALFEHGGDFSEAAKQLSKEGYGEAIYVKNDIDKPEPEPAPIECDDKSLDFPYKIMKAAANYFSNVYGEVMEAPQHFFFMSYLTCLGAYFAPFLRVKSSLETQPRLFCVIVGESASERKSTTLTKVVKHFRSAFSDFNACFGIGSAEGLQNVLNQGDEENPLAIIKEGTLLVFDEFKSFVSKCQIDTSVLLPIVNSLFENNLYETHTKTRSIRIENAFLSMLAATTRQTYERIYTPAFINIGFVNRVFLVPGTAQRKFSIPPVIDSHEKHTINEHLEKIREFIGHGIEFDFTQEAKEIYHNWYMEIEDSIHTKRLDTYSLRIMQLLAVNSLKKTIDAEITQDAIDLCDWQFEVRKIFDPVDADNNIARMEESIRRNLKRGPLSDRELKRKTNYNRVGLWIYDTALKNLRSANEIGWNKKNSSWYLAAN